MLFNDLDRYRDAGLLILRIGIGIAFVVHGAPKMLGGPAGWTELGGSMRLFGITFLPAAWGFMAAFAELGGGILLILGLLTRPAAFFLFCTMVVAAATHIAGVNAGSPWHAIEAGVLFFSLLFIGPGAYSLDARLGGTSHATLGGDTA